MASETIYKRFDRAVSQQRVGAPGAAAKGNHNSCVLNERGPALKVFWPRNDSGWVQDQHLLWACLQEIS